MIDWTRVRELKDEIGEEDFAEVVELFLEEVEEVIDRLRVAPEPGRMEEDMHFLKGSALNLGFRQMGALCATAERSAATGQPDVVDVGAVVASFERSRREFLAEHLGTAAAA